MDQTLSTFPDANGGHTAFIDRAAAEAWDAEFRYRRGSELVDVTIDDTRSRVIGALRPIVPDGGPGTELADDIAEWRFLPDPRILARAGTPGFAWPRDDVVGAINLARFVAHPFTQRASLRGASLVRTIASALCVLDGTRVMAGDASTERLPPRLGIVGLADALAMLGSDYATQEGRDRADAILRVFAHGVIAASVRLARDRGARDDEAREHAIAFTRARFPGDGLAREVRRYGLRFDKLTALMPLPRLALFADNVADAAAPLSGEHHVHRIPNGGAVREITASGYALTLWRRSARAGDVFPYATADAAAGLTQSTLAMQSAVRAWLDYRRLPQDEVAAGC